MLTRRTLLMSSLAVAALFAAPPMLQAQSTAQASQFVDQTAKALIAVIDQPGSPAQKRPQLQQIVDRTVAVQEVAQFCLGRHWRDASPAQQQQYVQLFHAVLLDSITGHLGDYKGITYSIGRPAPGEGGVEVPSTLNRPGQAPANLTWVISDVGGSPKIIDVIAEGTSMRLTQRSDYDSFLNRNGGSMQTLLDALRRKASAAG